MVTPDSEKGQKGWTDHCDSTPRPAINCINGERKHGSIFHWISQKDAADFAGFGLVAWI